MAHWEREEIVDRTKASIAVRAKLGIPPGSPALFEYEWKDKQFVPNLKGAKVRKLMYELFLKHRRNKTVVRRAPDAQRNGCCNTSAISWRAFKRKSNAHIASISRRN